MVLISSVKFLLQVDWWNNHRSVISILYDLLLISSSKRYSVNSPEAAELRCQLTVQFNHASIVVDAIKNNVIWIHLPYKEKVILIQVLNENVKVPSNMLSLLGQKNLLFAGFCTKISLVAKLIHAPEFLFSTHPKLFYSLINNEFLLQNSSEMRDFLNKCFSNDLFKITDVTWKGHWRNFQELN